MSKKGKKKGKASNKPKIKTKELLSADGGEELDVTDVITRIEKLSPDKREAVCRMSAMKFSGPVPPPDVLQGYENTLKGAADRILTMAEGEAVHRRSMEKRIVSFDATEHLMGLVFGLIVALAGIVGGVWCIISGMATAGSILAGGTILSLVSVFVYGSRAKSGSMPLDPQMQEVLKNLADRK